nr:SGNH/GDSL hydrolase family protein [Bacteroidales bacterium]
GKTLFFGFELGNSTMLPRAEPRKRKMEFYGNSITCGYANEDTSGKDRSIGYYQNNYETYAAMTARHFEAQYHCIAKSGIGVLVSWFPMIMSEMYDRTDPTDASSKWDFSRYTPDVVVVNLFQNDSWIVNIPNNEQYKSRFGDVPPTDDAIVAAYKEVVSSIRTVYPKASIICTLGSMDATKEGSQWPGYIQEAVDQLNDTDVYTCFFPFKKSGGHPKVADHRVMANALIAFIDEHIVW